MSWLNGFELICYLICAAMLVDLIRKRDWNSIFAFGSAALVGFTWFACITFVALWSALLVMPVRRCIDLKLRPGRIEWPMLTFWAAMYGYCLITLCTLGLAATAPWFMAVGVLFTAGTLYIATAKE